MGLHTGSAQMRAGDYYGPVVNRCARIRGLGHGGQILLSAATASLVQGVLPAKASLRSLGAHSLKGISEPEEVFQLCHPDLPGDFPPLLSPQAPRHNLPLALSSLIGREAEQGDVLALLATARLVTLTGSGGVGKTRLALAVAAELMDQYADGIWLVELAPLSEPSLVPAAVAQVLGVREEPSRPLTATLVDHLKDKRLLLFLDNCEHLVAACADLAAALLRACPGLSMLATSREGLEIAGEQRWRVPSLSVPDPRHLPPPELTGSFEAVRLFVARAKERHADFALTAQNARAAAQICARLDGIPLAIELAAARMPALGVEGLAARLDDRFSLLTGGSRDALPRQRTLRAALAWSYDLLTEQEQLLLDRLSVFAGGCTLAAVETVCAGDGVEKWEMLDLLGGLVNKSLVQTEERQGGEMRYTLLETVRQYGQERLAAGDTAEGPQDRHLACFLALAEEAAPQIAGPEQAAWLERLEIEHDNLRAALGRAVDHERSTLALNLVGELWSFWSARGHLSEGRRWLDLALAMPGSGLDADEAVARLVALHGATMLAIGQADLPHATELAALNMTQARALGDPGHLARALDVQGLLARLQGDHTQAIAVHQEALALARQTMDRVLMADAFLALAMDFGFAGDFERSDPLFAEGLALCRAVGDRRRVADLLCSLALQATMRGAHVQAETRARDAAALFRELGDSGNLAQALMVLGIAMTWQGAHAEARTHLEESLALRQERGDRHGAGYSLSALALARLLEGEIDAAMALAEDGLALLRESGDRAQQAIDLAFLAHGAIWREHRERAVELLVESLTLYKAMGARRFLPWVFEGTARIMAGRAELTSAVRFYSAMANEAQATGFSWVPLNRPACEETMATAKRELGSATFAEEWAAGEAMTPDGAIALALESLGR